MEVLFVRVKYTISIDQKSVRYLMDQANLNMRQNRWLDVVKEYDYEILYNLRKDNVVVDNLSRKVESRPVRDLCLSMVSVSPLLALIK